MSTTLQTTFLNSFPERNIFIMIRILSKFVYKGKLILSFSIGSCHGLRRISKKLLHYNDVIMDAVASQITSLTIVYSTVDSDADQRKHQSSAWLAFVGGIHRGPVNSPHKWPVTRKMFPFDDVIMILINVAQDLLCHMAPLSHHNEITTRRCEELLLFHICGV